MDVSFSHPFNAGMSSLLELFLSEGSVLTKNQLLGHRNVKVMHLERSSQQALLMLKREVQASVEVPNLLRSFHREWTPIEQQEDWRAQSDGSWLCQFHAQVSGMPIILDGTMHLTGDDEFCHNQIKLKVRCDIPFFGRKVASFLAEDSFEKISREYEIMQGLLRDIAA